MITDLHVLVADDQIFLDVPAELASGLVQRLDRNVFTEDVRLANLSDTLTSVWIHGPAAPGIVGRVLGGAWGLVAWPMYCHAMMQFEQAVVRVARIDQLGVPGYCIYVAAALAGELRARLEAAGVTKADQEAVDAARIEAGYPVFGVDMTDDTIPLEAGIEDRAISFTKGCYVGQEVIVRVVHRGHGRVARRLVGLRLDAPVSHGARIVADGREIGGVTSAAESPRTGPIAMGYVHRDFTVAGTRVGVDMPGATVAAVVSRGGPSDPPRV